MKINELKTGVVYRHISRGVKAVVLTLDHVYVKPSSGMHSNREVPVVDASTKGGSSKMVLVVEASQHYPDELLLKQARDFKLVPVLGETWPFKFDRDSIARWNPGDNALSGEKTKYLEGIFESYTAAREYDPNSTFTVIPQPALWVPRLFECEWSDYVTREAIRKADELEESQREMKLAEAQSSKSRELIKRVKEIEGAVKSELPTNWNLEGRRGGSVQIQNEALEHLLSLIPATAK